MFSHNIERLRSVYGITQGELGRALGVSRSTVSQWERGYATPRMGMVQKISDMYKVPKSWLIEEGGMDGVVLDLASGKPVKTNGQGLLPEAMAMMGALGDDDLRNVMAYMRGILDSKRASKDA